MNILNLSRAVKTMRIKPDASGFTVAAGTSDVNSDIVDTQGFEGVRFITGWGAIVSGAVTSFKVQQNSINSGTGMADLEGSNQAVADTADNTICISDIFQPRKRYLRVAYDRGTQNATIDFLIVEFYGAKKSPIIEDSTTAAEIFAAPAEGTA